MPTAKEIICPATDKPCPSQYLGALSLGEICNGPKITYGSLEVEYCAREKLTSGEGLSPPASKIIENAIKKIRG